MEATAAGMPMFADVATEETPSIADRKQLCRSRGLKGCFFKN